MYQALYRKYRPKNFDDVVGQDVVIKTLKNSILNDKISHAYLFSGPRGCGKTSIAKIFARIVNCKNLDGFNPCNECVCCTQQNDQNLDIIEMDAASNNGVDEIREINNKVNLVPTLGKYKVYIIDEVHMLTIGAFNALLKTLEEPPAHVIFILATTDPHKVPITILSRCQKFDFKKISEEKIYKRIAEICENEKIKADEIALKEIARLGDGSLRDTLSILDQVISYAENTITLNDIYEVNGTISQKDLSLLVEKIIENNLVEIIGIINKYNDNGKSIIKITEDLILYFRNSILAKNNSSLVGDISLYDSVIKKLSISKVIEYIEILNSTLLDMKKFSNSKMLLELAMIKMISLDEKNYTISNEKSEKIVEKQDYLDIPIEKNFPGNNENIDNIEIKSKKIEENKIKESEEKTDINNKNISKENIDYEKDMSKLDKFIDIRVSNTLANFSKKETNLLKEKLKQLEDYILDEKYGEYVSMIMDGELKAVGNEYVIFEYPSEYLTNLFNEKLIDIEKSINKILNNSYKVIAVDSSKWNEIKEKFNSKKYKFEYQEESINYVDIIKNLNQKDDDKIQSLFGELVEYN